MSLVVTFKGQFKPYEFEKIHQSDRFKRIAGIAPTFNDLLHRHLDEKTLELQEQAKQEHQNKAPSAQIQAYEKAAKVKNRRFYAKDVMCEKVITIAPDKTLDDALQMMGQHQFHHIPVVENGLLKGIISDRLILSHLAKAESKKSLIETIMVEQVLTADVHTSIADISRAMLDEKVSCLPVIDQKLHLKGMITTSDILSLMIMSFPLDIYS